MKRNVFFAATVCAIAAVVAPPCALADETPSGFLSDYEQLQPMPGYAADRAYLVPDSAARFAQYDAVMVDQPEVFIASDSKYKGIKPDDLKVLADSFRAAVTEELAGAYRIAEAPGPGVLYLRFATTGLQLKKKKNLLDFTPVGVVTNVVPGVKQVKNAIRNAAIEDLSKRVSLVELTIEAELLDSLSGERLAALIEQVGQRKDREAGLEQEETSWEEVDATVRAYGERMACRFGNARLEAAQRQDCRLLEEASLATP